MSFYPTTLSIPITLDLSHYLTHTMVLSNVGLSIFYSLYQNIIYTRVPTPFTCLIPILPSVPSLNFTSMKDHLFPPPQTMPGAFLQFPQNPVLLLHGTQDTENHLIYTIDSSPHSQRTELQEARDLCLLSNSIFPMPSIISGTQLEFKKYMWVKSPVIMIPASTLSLSISLIRYQSEYNG